MTAGRCARLEAHPRQHPGVPVKLRACFITPRLHLRHMRLCALLRLCVVLLLLPLFLLCIAAAATDDV